jgi:hypothetical protein
MPMAHTRIRFALFVTAVAATTCVNTIAAQRIPAEAWANADLRVRRLSPNTFEQLPALIRKELIRLGCTIPQIYDEERPHNVISGRFMSPGGADWAVLCSRDRISAILVFPQGRTPPIELAAAPDANFLQGLGGSTIGFSRVISVASPRFIRAAGAAGHGGPAPPPLDHDGIDDAFAGKGSSVLYFYSGKWLTLAGSD